MYEDQKKMYEYGDLEREKTKQTLKIRNKRDNYSAKERVELILLSKFFPKR